MKKQSRKNANLCRVDQEKTSAQRWERPSTSTIQAVPQPWMSNCSDTVPGPPFNTLPWSFMSGWAEMVIWVPCCISFSISNKDLGTGVSSSILTQEQGKEWSHKNLVIVKQKKKKSSLLQTLQRFSSFNWNDYKNGWRSTVVSMIMANSRCTSEKIEGLDGNFSVLAFWILNQKKNPYCARICWRNKGTGKAKNIHHLLELQRYYPCLVHLQKRLHDFRYSQPSHRYPFIS